MIRVPAYAGGAPVPVTGRLLNRLAQPMRDLGALPDAGGVTQFDLPLAPLAPGEYYLQFSVRARRARRSADRIQDHGLAAGTVREPPLF